MRRPNQLTFAVPGLGRLAPSGLALLLTVLVGCGGLPAGKEQALLDSSAGGSVAHAASRSSTELSLDDLEPTGAGGVPQATQATQALPDVWPAAPGAGAGSASSVGKTLSGRNKATRTPAPVAPEASATPAEAAANPSTDGDLARFQVVLTADQVISEAAQGKGELRVWLGDPSFKPEKAAGMVQGSAEIVARSNTAKVTPFAPNFDIDPKESKCITIDPTGSETRFTLTAREPGEFKVGATVELYAKADCTGPFIPKTAATVAVKVEVRGQFEKDLKTSSLDAVLGFWKELLALVFGSALFLLRNVLKEKE